MRNERPTLALLKGGPLAGRAVRVPDGARYYRAIDAKTRRVHLYRLIWPETPDATVLQVAGVYEGTRRG